MSTREPFNADGRVTKQDIRETAQELDLNLLPEEEIQPGDTYLAGRNTGVKLLTCNYIKMNSVFPKEKYGYPYNVWECVKVKT